MEWAARSREAQSAPSAPVLIRDSRSGVFARKSRSIFSTRSGPPARRSRRIASGSTSMSTREGMQAPCQGSRLGVGSRGPDNFVPRKFAERGEELPVAIDDPVAAVEFLDPGVVFLVERAHRAGISGIAEVDPAPQHAVIADRAEALLEIRTGSGFPRRGFRKTRVGDQIVELKPGGPQFVSVGLEAAAAAGTLANGAKRLQFAAQVQIELLQLAPELGASHR